MLEYRCGLEECPERCIRSWRPARVSSRDHVPVAVVRPELVDWSLHSERASRGRCASPGSGLRHGLADQGGADRTSTTLGCALVRTWITVGRSGCSTSLQTCSSEHDTEDVLGETDNGTEITVVTDTRRMSVPCRGWVEQDQGPYHREHEPLRQRIAEDRPGAPLDLFVELVHADGKTPAVAAARSRSGIATHSGATRDSRPPAPNPLTPPRLRQTIGKLPTRASCAVGRSPGLRAPVGSARSIRVGTGTHRPHPSHRPRRRSEAHHPAVLPTSSLTQ